jgi:hypothetical protein
MANQKPFVRNSSIPLAPTQFETDATFVKPASSKGFIYADPEKVTVKRFANGDYRSNPDGTISSHKMASFSTDKGEYAAPTLYPKDRKGTKSHASRDWYEAPSKGFAFADTAQARGELYGPFKTRQIADKFADNGYKKQPIQIAASKKLVKKK